MAFFICTLCQSTCTDEEYADMDLVCPTCGEEDSCVQMPQTIHEPIDPASLRDVEEMHIPFFREDDTGHVRVRIGRDENFHPMDDEHSIIAVGVYGDEGETIDILTGEDLMSLADGGFVTLDTHGQDPYEVRSTCELHGTWRGMKEQ